MEFHNLPSLGLADGIASGARMLRACNNTDLRRVSALKTVHVQAYVGRTRPLHSGVPPNTHAKQRCPSPPTDGKARTISGSDVAMLVCSAKMKHAKPHAGALCLARCFLVAFIVGFAIVPLAPLLVRDRVGEALRQHRFTSLTFLAPSPVEHSERACC